MNIDTTDINITLHNFSLVCLLVLPKFQIKKKEKSNLNTGNILYLYKVYIELLLRSLAYYA